MARRHHHKRVEATNSPVPFNIFPLPKFARICSFHTFSGYLFRVAFPARMALLKEERVTGYRKVVMTSGVDFLVCD